MAETPPFTPSPTDPTHTGEYCIEQFSDMFDQLYEYVGPTAAKGAMASLAERIAVSIDTDGTLKTSVTTGEWLDIDTSLYTYVGATSFAITGDYTAHFPTGRKVRFTNASGTATYGNVVVASVYTATTGVIVTGGAISSPSYLSLGMGPYSMPDRQYTPGASAYISTPAVTANDEFVTLAASQTLTNKTFTSAYLTAPGVALGVFASATMTSPVVYGGTFTSATMSTPTLEDPTLTGNAAIASCAFSVYPTVPATAPTASSQVAPKDYVDNNAGGLPLGYKDGFTLAHSASTAITVSDGELECNGSDYSLATSVTVTVTPASSAWRVILFDPDLLSTPAASSFIEASVGAIAWDATKHGWYDSVSTDQRAVGLYYGDSTAQVEEFSTIGGWFEFLYPQIFVDTGAGPTTITAVDCGTPDIGVNWKVEVDAACYLLGNPSGVALSSGDDNTWTQAGIGYTSYYGFVMGYSSSRGLQKSPLVTDTSGNLYYSTYTGTETVKLYLRAFVLPRGM